MLRRTKQNRLIFRLRFLIGAVPLLAALPLAAQPSDTWYVVTIAGQPVGSMHEAVAEADGAVHVRSEAHLVLNRMGSKVEMQMGEVSREGRDGRLLGMDLDLKLSTQGTSTSLTLENGVVKIREKAGDRTFERTVPYTGDVLGPEGIRKLSAARLRKPGDHIEIQTWVPDQGGMRKMTRTVAAEEAAPGSGPARTLKVEEATEGNPAKRLLWLDADGRIVQSSDPGPFGEMRTARVDEAAAHQAEKGGELPAESYGKTLVHTQVRIPHPRRAERVVLRLHHRDPGLGWPDFTGPGQRVIDKTADTLTLEITRPQPQRGQPFPPSPTTVSSEEKVYLEPTAYIQSDDPKIRAEAQAIVAGEKDVFEAGRKLQLWVTKHMDFDLGIVFAPSTEVFANRRGTCAGYAMLLTTMARAVGIPARYVLGYVYLDGMFGGHAWTEIKVGKDWIPLDSAVPSDGPADATHLALLRSSLAEGVTGLSSSAALQMFGHLDIDVLSVQDEGRPMWTVPANARLYTVDGDVYRNTGLGIQITKPSNFRFVGLDEVWPENRIVGMEGPDWRRVNLLRVTVYPGDSAEKVAWKNLDDQVPDGRHKPIEAAGRPAWSTESEKSAALAWRDGEDLWILTVEARDAQMLMQRIAATLKLPE
jgi:hypothetical protein